MSFLLTSSSYIKIDSNKIHTLLIKNTKTSNFSKSSPIIFKVKTNLIYAIDVRPSYGILLDNDAKKSVASLQIKYTGTMEEVPKGKLLINWTAIQSSDVQDKKLQHNQFADLYKKYQLNTKQYRQNSIIVPFCLQDPAESSQSSQQKQANSGEKQEQFVTQDNQQVSPIITLKKNEEYSQTNNLIKPVQQLNGEPAQIQKQGIRISVVNLAILIILALILGIFVGSEIQKLRASTQLNIVESQNLQQENKQVPKQQPQIQIIVQSEEADGPDQGQVIAEQKNSKVVQGQDYNVEHIINQISDDIQQFQSDL